MSIATVLAPAIEKLTYDDLCTLPDDGRRHELIDGVHYVTPAPRTKHQRIVRNALVAIHSYLAQKRADGEPMGEIFVAPYDILLTDSDVVEPDLVFITAARRHLITDANLPAAPDLVVEVLSESTRRRDERLKRDLYARHGVREYWVVDPEVDVVKVYRQAADGAAAFAAPQELSLERQETLTSQLLPGLELALSELFRD
jgi:Uma2 family endonuclease